MISKNKLGLGFFIFLSPFMLHAQTPGRNITLDDAIRYAVEHNYAVQALKQEVNAHDAEIAVQRSKYLPRFGVVAGGETKRSSAESESAALGYLYGSWNLFNGFADQNEMRRADSLKNVAESQYRQGLNHLKLDVEGLFYKYLFKKKTLVFLGESLKLNENHQASIRRRRASGLVSEADAMEFELRDSYLRSEMNSVSLELSELKLQLVRLMGPDLGLAFEPSGEIPHLHLKGQLDDYLKRTRGVNEDTQVAAFEVEGALADLRIKRSGWLPKIDLEGQVGQLPLDDRPSKGGSAFKGLITAKWEFFSGLETQAELSKSESLLQKRELELKQTLLSAMAAVEIAVRKLQSIQQRVDLEDQNERRSEKLYRSTLSEYNRGVKNSSDLSSAESTLLEARLRRATFKNDFLETKLELERKHNIRVDVEDIKEDLRLGRLAEHRPFQLTSPARRRKGVKAPF